MPRTLLLCFIHGFKGSDDTFQRFPEDLKKAVTEQLPEDNVHSVVYPKYETKGELAQCSEQFLEWLKERVMELRKAHSEKPWPPSDRNVGVILIAHSMGGFVASDTLFLILNERHNSIKSGSTNENGGRTDAEKAITPPPLFPLIQGVLAFDTPYNGLARSMFVYGAFSNYNKVSSVFNVMTALAAAPAGLSKLAVRRATTAATSVSRAGAPRSGANPGWKAWQLLAVRTGTVGAIAAGGVAAYVHRREIAAGIKSVRELDRASIAEGYQRGVGALGQGLAYINRGNVGKSYAWLADHFTFVGALVKPRELERRLGRLAALEKNGKGIGIRDMYASMGENGYWSGGYFVPERTFCAVPNVAAAATAGEKKKEEPRKSEGEKSAVDKPKEENPATALFDRVVVDGVTDEVDAHMSMFKPDKNAEYNSMTDRAAKLVIGWFQNEDDVVEDSNFADLAAEAQAAEAEDSAGAAEEEKIKATDEGLKIESDAEIDETAGADAAATSATGDGDEVIKKADPDNSELPDESPIDITAAASLVPLPDDDLTSDGKGPSEQDKQTYLRHLFGVAEQAGTGLRAATATWSSRLPGIEQIPKPSLPSMPNMPNMPNMPIMPTIPKPSMPAFGSMFSKKGTAEQGEQEDGEKLGKENSTTLTGTEAIGGSGVVDDEKKADGGDGQEATSVGAPAVDAAAGNTDEGKAS